MQYNFLHSCIIYDENNNINDVLDVIVIQKCLRLADNNLFCDIRIYEIIIEYNFIGQNILTVKKFTVYL